MAYVPRVYGCGDCNHMCQAVPCVTCLYRECPIHVKAAKERYERRPTFGFR